MSDCSKIAQMHQDYILGGFLSCLGHDFLNLLYETILEYSEGVLLVVEFDGQLAGFVAGVLDTKEFYRYFLRKNFFRAGFMLVGRLFQGDTFVRVMEVLFYPKKSSKLVFPRAELLSMAVCEDFRRKGVGGILFDGLVERLKARGVGEFKIVVGSALSSSKIFYINKGSGEVGSLEVHKGHKSDVLIRKIL